jgi:hypothetical protein
MNGAVQMIEVVAPSNLKEGYLLDVELDGVVRTIVVVSTKAFSAQHQQLLDSLPWCD